MTLSKRDRRAVILGGGGLGVLLVYVFVIEPTAGAYADLADEHARLAGRLARQRYENDEAAYYTKRVAEWEARAEPLAPPKPFDEQANHVGEGIVASAQQNQVKLKNTNWSLPTAWPDDPALGLAVLHLEAEADWEPIFKFITAVYAIEGVLSVEEMELRGDPKKGGKLSLSLRVSVLVKADPQEGGLWAS